MQLSAAIVPPPRAVDDLTDAARGVPGGVGELAHLPGHALHIQLAQFGNVSMQGASALHEAFAEEFAGWEPIQLRFRGGAALEFDGDDSVWARLDGGIEALVDLANTVPRVVHRLHFLVDRRKFAPRVRVARITDATTAGYLQRVVDRLEAYEGATWTAAEVALLLARQPTDDSRETRYDVLHRLPLRGTVRHGH